ncbi:GST-30 protein [Aphelenchoides avenae]|nr:GST-30 protein [Aphelenchus avenae]
MPVPLDDNVEDPTNVPTPWLLGLEADTAENQALCDMYAEQMQDYLTPMKDWSQTFFGMKPAEERENYFQKDVLPTLNQFGEIYSELLKKSGSGYFIGPKITWLDVFVANFVDKMMHDTKKTDLFSKFPLIEEHHKKIFAKPSVAKYVKDRPDYPF